MKFNDAITGALFLVLAVLAFLYAGTFKAMPGVPYGPGLFPRLVAVMMGIGGVILIFSGLRRAAGSDGHWLHLAEWARSGRSYLVFFAIVGVMLFYILAAEKLGFLLTCFLMLTVLLTVTRGASRFVSTLVLSSVTTLGIHFLFSSGLRVPLPRGGLEMLLGTL